MDAEYYNFNLNDQVASFLFSLLNPMYFCCLFFHNILYCSIYVLLITVL